MYANLINNLAGKYGAGFGTPFNLDDLSGISELDINKVTTIRLIDVIGSIGMSGCNDNSGLKINDPFPTNFPTGGFDLDAVGAIHFMAHTSVMEHATPVVSIFPNPCTDQLNINVLPGRYTLSLYGIAGNAVFTGQFTDNICVATGKLATGVYYARITDENGIQWLERVVKY
jgi:hypothetical protein